jgi:hypothetical protein
LSNRLSELTELTESLQFDLSAMDFKTVMGRGIADPETTADLATELETVDSLSGMRDKQETYDAIATYVRNKLTAARDAAIVTGTTAVTDELKTDADAKFIQLRNKLKTCQVNATESLRLIKAALPDVSKAKQLAIDRFNQSINVITAITKQLQTHEQTISKLSEKLTTIYSTSDVSTEATGKEITRLQSIRKSVEEERTHLERAILEHFDESIRGRTADAKKTTIDLKVPKLLEKGHGVELIDNLKAFLVNRASEFYAIMPYLYRISGDFDSNTGTFYKPPTKLDRYSQVDPTFRQQYNQQANALYLQFKQYVPPDVMAKICSTFNYGMHEQFTARCEEGDGPTAYFCLLSLYRPSSAAYRDELVEKFNAAHLHFQKGDPRRKIQHLRTKLVEAIQLNIHLSWSTTGKKIVGVLSRRDHSLAQAIRKFDQGPPTPDDSALYLQDLFSTIVVECDSIDRLGGHISDDTNWHANTTQATMIVRPTQQQDRKDCWFGNDCRRKDCTFNHPSQRGQKRKNDHDSKRQHNNHKQTLECQAKGCKQRAPDDTKKFCTTCFKKGLTEGSITLKDGSKHNIKSKKLKTDNKTNYGFSAQQMKGLKILNQQKNELAGDTDLTQEPAAPASIKRKRIQERLGTANAAQEDNISKFLAQINNSN